MTPEEGPPDRCVWHPQGRPWKEMSRMGQVF